MTERVKKLLTLLKSGEYKSFRNPKKSESTVSLTDSDTKDVSALMLKKRLADEKPVVFDGDRIGFNRYCSYPTFSGPGNITPNYPVYLNKGFGGIYEHFKEALNHAPQEDIPFIKSSITVFEAIFSYCEKLKEAASGDLKKALKTVPYNPPETYHEALVTLKLIHFFARLTDITHITFGRFDQYMYPFYKHDIENGMTKDELLELTEEFFISINFDSDLYFGIQKGDNGQSMVLGGLDINGNDTYNELSEICMKASLELSLIDPKINLRVSKKTPDELYRFGTLLTKQGLGFPQYCNDDVVIPGLIKLGYAPEDAYNYAVAACWEFIVPDSFDIPNLRTMNFPLAVENATKNSLKECETFDDFLEETKKQIAIQATDLMDFDILERNIRSDTCLSLLLKPCIEQCRDYLSGCANYYNFGFHGAGIAPAADALAAIKKVIYDEALVSKEELLACLDKNFEGYSELRNTLLSCPKMGNNDDYADLIASEIMDAFCNSLSGKKNPLGGIYRPGTGSAMDYLTAAEQVGATADGRYAYTPYGSSFSPSISAKTNGLLSVIQSFTKFDLSRICNGGPLTVEIHENTFRNDYGIDKVAALVKLFVELGGHQLQLNSINRETLIDAQNHPENHKSLIVRVWGWSGYFNELDKKFQDHIISRTEFQI